MYKNTNFYIKCSSISDKWGQVTLVQRRPLYVLFVLYYLYGLIWHNVGLESNGKEFDLASVAIVGQ